MDALMSFAARAAVISCLAIGAPALSINEKLRPNEVRICAKRGDDKTMSALRGSVISATLNGKSVFADYDRGAQAALFSESFDIDGRWIMRVQSRTEMTYRGDWRIKGNKLCIKRDEGITICRSLYRNCLTGNLLIQEMFVESASNNIIPIIIKPII